MVDALESGQQHLAGVDGRIEAAVAIDVRVDDQIGRLRHHHLVVDDGDAQRGDEAGLLHEGLLAVGLAVTVRILEHHDAVTLGLTRVVRAIPDALRHPDAAVAIDVDVGWIEQQRRFRPEGDLEPVGQREELERHVRRRRSLWRHNRRDSKDEQAR